VRGGPLRAELSGSAIFTVYDSRRGTPGQLVGGTVVGQVAGNAQTRCHSVFEAQSLAWWENFAGVR